MECPPLIVAVVLLTVTNQTQTVTSVANRGDFHFGEQNPAIHVSLRPACASTPVL